MNMSYCRFQNTARDLQDCAAHLFDINGDSANDRAERAARAEIVRLAALILEEIGVDDPSDVNAIDAAIFELDQEMVGADGEFA